MAYVTNNGAVVTTSDAVDTNNVVYLGGIAIRKSDGAMHVTSGLTTAQLAALAANGATSTNLIAANLIGSRKIAMAKKLKASIASALTSRQSNVRYYDNSLTTGLNDGTSEANAWQTWALVKTWAETTLSGSLAGYTLAVKCGTTTYGGSELVGVTGVQDSQPFQIVPYGDGDLPVFAGGHLVTGWTANGDGTYWYSVAADCDAFENVARMLKKTITTGTEASVLLAAGTGTCGYNSSTNKIWIYPSSINNVLEINDGAVGLRITVKSAGAGSAGNIHIYGMHGRLARDNGIGVVGHSTVSANTYGGVQIIGCMAGNVGVDVVGGGSSVGDGILLYGPVANAEAVKATNCVIRGCYIYECLNNAVEIAATSKAIIELNESDDCGGNCICENWCNNDTSHIRYNIGRGDHLRLSRLNNGYFSSTAVWFHALLKSGSVDTAGTYSNNNKFYFNVAINPGIRGVRLDGSQSGTKIEHNTFLYTDQTMSNGNAVGAIYYSSCDAGQTQSVTLNRNLAVGYGSSLLGLGVVCDGTAATLPTGDYNAYVGQSVGWRYNGTTTFVLATWKAATAATPLDVNSLAGTNSGGTLWSDMLGIDWQTFRISPVSPITALGTDALGYTRDFLGQSVSAGASLGFIGAVSP